MPSAIGNPTLNWGSYVTSWNALALGLMEGDNGIPIVNQVNHAEEINSTDAWAKSRIEAIHQGFDIDVAFTLGEWRAAAIAVMNPFAALGGVGLIGASYTDLSQPLNFTAVTGTPAATAGPITLTANKAILAPNFNMRLLTMGPTWRRVPIRMVFFPYLNGAAPVHFVKT